MHCPARRNPSGATRRSRSRRPEWPPGAPVSLWLTGEAAWFGVPGRAEDFHLDLATPLAELRDIVLSGGTLTVCSQCAQRRGLVEADLVEGARIAGAATFTEEALADDAQALVY